MPSAKHAEYHRAEEAPAVHCLNRTLGQLSGLFDLIRIQLNPDDTGLSPDRLRHQARELPKSTAKIQDALSSFEIEFP